LKRVAESLKVSGRSKGECAGAVHAQWPAGAGKIYRDRYAVTEALRPMVRRELESLVAAGCTEICVDEPSMSCYAHKEDTHRFVDIFNRTVESVAGNAGFPRICVSETTRAERWGRGDMLPCFRPSRYEGG